MTRRKKIFIWLTGISIFFLLTINYIATMSINSEWTKKKIETVISQKIGGNTEYHSIDLSIFPFPHAGVHQLSISIPANAQGTVKTVKIFPKILHLFKGNLLIDKIQLESPDIKIIVTRSHEKNDKQKEVLTADMIKDRVAKLLFPLAAELPEIKVAIEDGKIDFVETDENIVTLRDVRIELGCISENIEIKMNCTSNLCKEISANASFDQGDASGDCEIRLNQIKPHALMDRFLSNLAFRFVKPMNKLTLRFKLDGINDLQVKLQGSPLYLMVDINKINAYADYDDVPYPLQINEWEIHYDGSKINVMNLSGMLGNSSFRGLNAGIGLKKDSRVEIQTDSILVSLDEIYQLTSSFEKMRKTLKNVKTVNGSLELTSLNLNGPFAMPEEWHIKATGVVKELAVDTTMFPEPVAVKEGHFEIADNKFSLTGTQVNVSDSSFRMKGVVDYNMKGLVKADMAFQGEIGHDSMHWAYNFFKLPSKFMTKSPLYLSQSNMTWEKDSGISLISNLAVQDSPAVSVDMLLNPEGLVINNLHIKGDVSQASIKISFKEKDINFNFSGNLAEATMDKIFLVTPISTGGWINGDFKVYVPFDQPEHFTFQGALEGKDFSIPWNNNVPLTVNSVSLFGKSKRVEVNSIMLTYGDENISLDGYINTPGEGITFDMDMFTSKLDWDVIRETLGVGGKEKNVNGDGSGSNKDEHFWEFPIKGELRLHSECFTYEQFTLNPLQADILFENEKIILTVVDANLCGFFLPGEVTVTPQNILLDFQLLSSYQELNEIISCMGNKERLITGNIDIDARVIAQGKIEDIEKALQGDFRITAKKGRIYKSTLLAKLIAFLNFTEIFRGKIPDLAKKGFAYRSITANGSVLNSTLMFDEIIIDGSSLGITGNGNIDLVSNKIDLDLLVSPLKTVDFVIKKVPIVGKILDGTLVAVPVKVKGDIANPKMSYSVTSAIGGKLLDITKKTLHAPVKIIKPVIPGKKAEN